MRLKRWLFETRFKIDGYLTRHTIDEMFASKIFLPTSVDKNYIQALQVANTKNPT